MASHSPRPPLLPWSSTTWTERWASMGRLSSSTIPRTPFLLLKAPASTLYEEKFGGDRNMFSVGMYCSRMMARSVRVGLVIDCTALDIEEFEPLPSSSFSKLPAASKSKFDKRVRYFHNPSEWDDYDVEYHRLNPPTSASGPSDGDNNGANGDGGADRPLAPQVLTEFYRTVSTFLQKSRTVAPTANGGGKCIALYDSRGGLGAAAYLAGCYMCHALRAPVHAAVEALREGTPMQSGDDAGTKWGLRDVRLLRDMQTRFNGQREVRLEGGVPRWWWALDDDDDDDDDDNDKEGDEGSAKKEKKRAMEEAIIIPPCDAPADNVGSKRSRTEGAGDAAPSSNGIYPNLPKEILQPIQKDSPKWNRALTVLSQMTTPQSSQADPATKSTLPLKPEVDVSNCDPESEPIQSIRRDPDKYKVTWLSTKGRRGLLLILSEAVYFIEQTDASSPISVSVVVYMKFPTPKDLAKTQHRTLLDVVLVKDVERNQPTYRFYALDMLAVEGGTVWQKPWEQRWRFLNEGVLVPRKRDEAQQRNSSHDYGKEPIKIRAKEYFPMGKLGFVMKDVCSGVGHDARGIRIVPIGDYGIESDGNISTRSLVWRSGCKLDDEKLKSLLLQ